VKLTTPWPLPLLADAIESQLASVRAVQEQWLAVETVADPVPPPTPNDSGEAVTLNVHGAETDWSDPQPATDTASASSKIVLISWPFLDLRFLRNVIPGAGGEQGRLLRNLERGSRVWTRHLL
jgi:hypothetical protein